METRKVTTQLPLLAQGFMPWLTQRLGQYRTRQVTRQMRQPRVWLGLLSCMFALSSLSATATGQNLQAKIDFIVDYDSNADGQVQHAEYWQRRQQMLAAMDRQQNAQVDLQGYQQAQWAVFEGLLDQDRQRQLRQTEVRFAAVDTDQDAVISAAEYHASGARAFAMLDRHHDGVLDGQDVAANVAGTTTQQQRRSSQSRSLQRSPALIMPTSHSVQGMLQMYDQNHDRKISQDEYHAIRQQVFARTDMDGNGVLSAQEYLAEFTDRLDQQIAQTRQHAQTQWAGEFAALDSDGNGILSSVEYHQAGAQGFAQWDTNQDRVVSMQDKLPAMSQSTAQHLPVQLPASPPAMQRGMEQQHAGQTSTPVVRQGVATASGSQAATTAPVNL